MEEIKKKLKHRTASEGASEGVDNNQNVVPNRERVPCVAE